MIRRSLQWLSVLLCAAPAFAQIRSAHLPARVPATPLGMAGAAAGFPGTLPTLAASPSLTLPLPVLAAPRAAAAPKALEAALPRDNARSAAAALAAPAGPANGVKKPWRAQTFAQMLADLKRRAAPPAADRPPSEASGRAKELFDGAAPAPVPAAPAAGPASYTGIFPGRTGTDLRDALREELRASHRGHDYETARTALFSRVDNVTVDGRRGVRDVYSGVFVPGRSGDGWRYRGSLRYAGPRDETLHLSVEHVWPQSFFGHRLPLLSDLHNMLPAFHRPNELRDRLPFGTVPDASVSYYNAFGARMGAGVFEPPDSAKGKVARALLYFLVRYGDEGILPAGLARYFWNSRIQTYLIWNRRFPPDASERERNDAVAALQGTRNPFVDDPSLTERIGAKAFELTPVHR
ncbi:MAG: endonuclease [Elusimicrobia bacterium]|nr:endonuclease [Elusimicrobiota bacterium]